MNKIKKLFTRIFASAFFFLFANGALAQFAQDRMMTKYGPPSGKISIPEYGQAMGYSFTPLGLGIIVSILLKIIYTIVLPLALLVWLTIGAISLIRVLKRKRDKEDN